MRAGSSRSRWGPTSRWKLATLACTQPARSVTRARAGPDRRAEAGGLGHQLLGLGGELLEVLLEEVGPVGGGQAAPVPHPAGHPLGGVPGHGPAVGGGPDSVAPVRSGPVAESVTGSSVGTRPRRRSARPPGRRRRLRRGRQLLWRLCSSRRASATRSISVVGHMVLAPAGDDLPELGLEPVGPDARPAQVEMAGDLEPPLLGQLAVEVEVEPLDGLVAADETRGPGTPRPPTLPGCPVLHLSPTGRRLPTWPRRPPRRGPSYSHDPPTPSAALFFHDGSGS